MQSISDTFLCLQVELGQPVPSGLYLQGASDCNANQGIFRLVWTSTYSGPRDCFFLLSWNLNFMVIYLKVVYSEENTDEIIGRYVLETDPWLMSLRMLSFGFHGKKCAYGVYSPSLFWQRTRKVPSQLQMPEDCCCLWYWLICLHLITWKAPWHTLWCAWVSLPVAFGFSSEDTDFSSAF